MNLFRTDYPESYSYFRAALENELRAPDTDDEGRATLTKALSQIDQVHVVQKCACGEPGCETFGFADYDEVGYADSFLLRSTPGTVVVDLDEQGNLIGLEKAP